jgi:cell envelope opacity-associated protein A
VFREYSTAAITPELLAALAQVEGAGNPLARTYTGFL